MFMKSFNTLQLKGNFHLCHLAGNVTGKLGNPYLRYQNRQLATCFLLTATPEMLATGVLPVKWKAPLFIAVYHVAILGFPDCLLLMITAVITILL